MLIASKLGILTDARARAVICSLGYRKKNKKNVFARNGNLPLGRFADGLRTPFCEIWKCVVEFHGIDPQPYNEEHDGDSPLRITVGWDSLLAWTGEFCGNKKAIPAALPYHVPQACTTP